MMLKQLVRKFHAGQWLSAVEKSGLATLRKKTGYTFANCKKALELHNNDLLKAEQWLKEQAQSLGWSKATKLEGRSTKQGLIGVLVQHNIAAMVEVNCETDFVARNSTFQQFVDSVTQACCQHVSAMPNNNGLSKIEFDGDALRNITLGDGKKLSDHLALVIGKVGENAALRRATCFKASDALALSAFTHPPLKQSTGAQLGRFGSIVAFEENCSSNDANAIEIRRNICQHIVGMNPVKIGVAGTDEPSADKDDERCLIFQEYLMDSSVTVADVLQENHIGIVEFHRYECGEQITNHQQLNETIDQVAKAAGGN